MDIQSLTITEKLVFKMIYQTMYSKPYSDLKADQALNAMVAAVGVKTDLLNDVETSLAAEFLRIYKRYPKISPSRMIQLMARVYAGITIEQLMREGKLKQG